MSARRPAEPVVPRKDPSSPAKPDQPRSAPSLRLSLQFADARHKPLLPRHRVRRWLRAALQADAELTVRIVGEDEARSLNRRYRGQDHATNVLTFDYHREPVVAADLVLAAPVVEREANARGLGIAAHYAHLLIHGALHAQGFDHLADADAAVMQARESMLMRALGLHEPYAARPQPQRGSIRRAASRAK